MKSAWRGVRIDGRNAYGRMFEVDEPTATLNDLPYHEAWRHILPLLISARRLGFDPGDPDILARAIRAGEAAFASQPKPVAHKPRAPATATAESHGPVVYYMKLGDLVKIGTTENIRARLTAINPERLLAVESGDRMIEAERHRDFAPLRQHGEWFRRAPQLDAHIEAVRSQFEATLGLTLEAWLAKPSRHGKPPTSSGSTAAYSHSGPESATSNRCVDSGSADPS